MIITALIVLGTRLIGPADLYEKDQPKTIAYTADMVVHGRYALPRDVIYQSATKPPMYNWIDAAVVKITGTFSELTLKFPSILGSILTAVFIYWYCRWSIKENDGIWLGLFCAAIWFTFGSDIRSGSVIRLSYLARPDMLQCAFLTGAWLMASIAVSRNKTFWHAMAFWIFVTCAALTKGPAAIMVVIFAITLAIIPKDQRLVRLKRLYIPIGLPITLLCVGAWLYCAYQQNPEHVVNTILKAEVASRVLDKSPEEISKPIYYTAMWFLSKTLPWGLISVVAWAGWFAFRKIDHEFLPAALWMVVALVMLSLPAGKRIDYLLPIYPPAAVLVGYLLLTLTSRRWTYLQPIIPVLIALFLSYSFLKRFHETKSHDSDRAIAFVNDVKKVVGDDTVLVINRGKHPIITLLGRHQGSYLTADDLAGVNWVIIPKQPGLKAEAVSEPVPTGFETIENRQHFPLALYRNGPGGPSLELLIGLQKAAGEWKIEENPYHEPNTVYREVSR